MFCHLQTVIVLLLSFCKSEFHGKDPTKYSWPLTLLPNYKVSNLGHIHNWRRLHLTSGPVGLLETLKSIRLGRKVLDIEVDCFLPRCEIKRIKNVSFLSYFPLWPSFSKFLYYEDLSDSFVHLFPCSGWKDNAIVHISQAIEKEDNPVCNWLLDLLQCCWSCSSFCLSQTSPWFSMPRFFWNKITG